MTSFATSYGALQISGALRLPVATKTADYTATADDYWLVCTTVGITITLPTAVGITGRVYVIKNLTAGTITITSTSSQTFDGAITGAATSVTVPSGAAYHCTSDGTNWFLT